MESLLNQGIDETMSIMLDIYMKANGFRHQN